MLWGLKLLCPCLLWLLNFLCHYNSKVSVHGHLSVLTWWYCFGSSTPTFVFISIFLCVVMCEWLVHNFYTIQPILYIATWLLWYQPSSSNKGEVSFWSHVFYNPWRSTFFLQHSKLQNHNCCILSTNWWGTSIVSNMVQLQIIKAKSTWPCL